MKIAICDDVIEHINTIKQIISENLADCTEGLKISTYSNGNDLIQDNKENNFDLICLDIEMPEIDGFKVAGKIREDYEDAVIVFITSKNGLVFDSFTFRPFSFVRKDNIKLDMKKTFNDFKAYRKNQNIYVTVKTPKEIVRWKATEIIYIESVKNDIILYKKNDVFKARGKLCEKERELSKHGFIRIHSGLLVNYRYIESMGKASITLTNGVELPVSRNRYMKVKEKLQDLILKEKN